MASQELAKAIPKGVSSSTCLDEVLEHIPKRRVQVPHGVTHR